MDSAVDGPMLKDHLPCSPVIRSFASSLQTRMTSLQELALLQSNQALPTLELEELLTKELTTPVNVNVSQLKQSVKLSTSQRGKSILRQQPYKQIISSLDYRPKSCFTDSPNKKTVSFSKNIAVLTFKKSAI